MTGPVSSASKPYALEGVVFTGRGGGPAIDSYRTAGGAYTDIFNAVARRLDTRNEAIILRELHRQDDAQRAAQQSPQESAAQFLAGARLGPTHTNAWNTEKLAAQIVHLRRDNPAQAAEIERLIVAGLGNVGDQSRLAQDIATATRHIGAADLRLNGLGADAPAATGPAISKAALTARVNDLIAVATDQGTRSRGNPGGADRLNVTELAYQVEQVAAQNPRLAQVLRSELTTRLDAQGAAELNRLLAGDTGFGDGVNLAARHPVDAAIGGIKGIANSGIALGDALARGSALQAAGEQEQSAAFLRITGNDKTADQLTQSAEAMRAVGNSQIIPQIPYSNIAQSGGGDIGTVIDVAMAGKGLVSLSAKSAAKLAAKSIDGADDAFTHGLQYAERVRTRAIEDPKSHNFPYAFDDTILTMPPVPKTNGYTIYQAPGSMDGKLGVFEIGVTKDGFIDHRFFRPNK
jgi:hypothetical protein